MNAIAPFRKPCVEVSSYVGSILEEPERRDFAPGRTIAEYIRATPGMPDRFWKDGIALLGKAGDDSSVIEIPREVWHLVRPRLDRDTQLILMLPSGFSGGAGNVIAVVAAIALIVAATAVSGGALGPAGLAVAGELFAAGSISASIAAGAVLGVGALALAALSPPPSTGAIESPGSSTSGTTSDRTSSLEGNFLRPGEQLPFVIGTHRIFPVFIEQPFTYMEGDDEITLASYAIGGGNDVREFRFEGAEADRMDNVEIMYHSGVIGDVSDTLAQVQASLTLHQKQSKTFILGAIMSEHAVDQTSSATTINLEDQTNPINSSPKWEKLPISRGSPDQVLINLGFPQGLFDQDNASQFLTTPFRIRMRKVDDSGANWIGLPEIHIGYNKQKAFAKDVYIIWGTAPALPTPPVRNAPIFAFTHAPMRHDALATEIGSGGWNWTEVFDGDTDNHAWAGGTVQSAWVGSDFGAFPRSIAGAHVWPHPTNGFFSGAGSATTVDVRLYASNSAPASATNGTLLGSTGAMADTTTTQYITSNDPNTSWRYIWIALIFDGTTANPNNQATRFYGGPNGNFGWSSHSDFQSGAFTITDGYLGDGNSATTTVRNVHLYEDKVIYYLNEANIPKGEYEFEIKRGCIQQESVMNWSFYREVATATAEFFRWNWDASSMFEVLRALNGVYAQMVIKRVSHLWNEHPVQTTDATIIQVKVTGRRLGALSCIASQYVKDWDSTGWNSWSITSNPAPNVRWLLAGPFNQNPVNTAVIDANFEAFRDECSRMGHEANMVVEKKSMLAVAQAVAAAGYAKLYQGDKFHVVMDRDRAAEGCVQIFTPRNSRDYAYDKAFPERQSGFRVQFRNAASDWAEDEIIVLDPEGDQGDALETVRYDAITDETKVQERALFDLKQLRVRMEFHRLTVNRQALKCKAGDLVGVQHHMLDRQTGSAYVKSITTSGGLVQSITLDGTVPKSQNGVAIRLTTGEIITAQLVLDTAGDPHTSTLTMLAPFTAPSGLQAGCLVVVGPLNEEVRRLIVVAIMPQPTQGGDMRAEITMVPEAPTLWGY